MGSSSLKIKEATKESKGDVVLMRYWFLFLTKG
jgi:hypothetical protein